MLVQSLFEGKIYSGVPIYDAVDIALDQLVGSFVEAMKKSELNGLISRADRGLHLSALFDLAVTGLYTNKIMRNSREFAQPAVLSGPEYAYFPYTWMDPGSLAEGKPLAECYLPGARREKNRDFAVADRLAKPGGRFIGDVGIKVLKAILRAIFSVTRPFARMRDGGGERGEFDLTITDRDHLIFLEVKAKPLVCYPLRLRLTEKRNDDDLAWKNVSMNEVQEMALFLGATGHALPIDHPVEATFATWPLRHISDALLDSQHFMAVVQNWTAHLRGYQKWEGEPRETRWHRFGCGNFSVIEEGTRIEKRVANTKELPGLDRTDDIKKGAAQLLKFSRFKFDCKKEAIRCVLAGNTYAETHSSLYIDPLINLKIRRADDPLRREEWIFDAIIGLTKNVYNDPDMCSLFDLASL